MDIIKRIILQINERDGGCRTSDQYIIRILLNTNPNQYKILTRQIGTLLKIQSMSYHHS